MARRLLIILGPTAVGKTDFAIGEALKYGSPVISCDSRQVFKEMSIGTAVPSASQLAAVRHYFIHTRSVTEDYTAGQYEEEAVALIEDLFSKGHQTLVMSGGSMLYIDAVCNGFDKFPDVDPAVKSEVRGRLEEEGLESLVNQLRELDPQTCAGIDLANSRRVVRALEICLSTGRPFSSFKTGGSRKRDFEIEKIGLNRPRPELYGRIDARVLQMMEAGLEAEVRSLAKYRNLPSLQTVGYREMFEYLDGRISIDRAIELIQQHSRNYAKRQLTWWRSDPSITWKSL